MTPEQANASERRYLALDHAAGYHDILSRPNCPLCEARICKFCGRENMSSQCESDDCPLHEGVATTQP